MSSVALIMNIENREERDRLLGDETSPLADYTVPRVHRHYSAIPNRHRNLCDTNGNTILSQGYVTPVTDGPAHSSPVADRGDYYKDDRVMESHLDEPSHSGRQSYVAVEKSVPRPKACLSVVGLTYTVKENPGHWWNGNMFCKTKRKQVFHNLTMTFNKGELTALIGASGTLSSEHIEKKVQGVIEDMGLRHVADSRIGGTIIRGVSGGEKRRITIGVQLLKDPDILLLDEPTSGLDSFTARYLVSTLASIAHNRNKLVLMSVHQPRSDIVNMLDKIGILTSGQLAYVGPPSEMVPYFTSIGHPCPLNENPCDFYLDITSVDRRTPNSERTTLRNAQKFCNAFSQSRLQESMIGTITSGLNYHYDDEDDLRPSQQYQSPSWFRISHCLLERMNVHLWRDRANLVGRLCQLPVFVPFMILYIGRLGYTMASIQDRMGLIYQGTQAPPYIGLTNALHVFPALRELYYRESQDGMYSTATFLTAYFLHILPFNILSSVFFSVFLYWVAGFNDDILAFGMFVLVIVVLSQFGEMMAVAVMGVFRTSQLSSDTTSLVFSASGFLATGLIRSVATQPKILQWLGYIAIHKYSTEIVIGNEFQGLEFDCTSGGSCSQTGDNFIDTYYPGALEHINRNFSLLGGFSIGILIFAVFMFKLRGTPTLH
ncbi:ATP-binding cassette sub-family G member 5 [Elysia marginata]|uniref:ATP-binding cassette sub-family G member 5 n=1 Tax=Elysia marginata TaxID=1093978 RepID=A0AAV4HMR2_9GAST|nr:ATP-binding cassette sub-family G member 5 [Elysia marginata]